MDGVSIKIGQGRTGRVSEKIEQYCEVLRKLRPLQIGVRCEDSSMLKKTQEYEEKGGFSFLLVHQSTMGYKVFTGKFTGRVE